MTTIITAMMIPATAPPVTEPWAPVLSLELCITTSTTPKDSGSETSHIQTQVSSFQKKNGVRDIMRTIKQAQWRWAGHTARRNDKRLTTRIMDWQPRTANQGKEVDREEDGEMTSGYMQEQHRQELHEIKMNGIYMRPTSYTASMMMKLISNLCNRLCKSCAYRKRENKLNADCKFFMPTNILLN